MKIVLTNKEMNLLQGLPREIKEIFNLPKSVATVKEQDKEIIIDISEDYMLKMGEEYKTLAFGFFGLGATASVLFKNFIVNAERINKEVAK